MRTPRKQEAFTVVEALMALTILAILMAAVAVTFDASVKNFNTNQGISRTVNTGRQALLRITNDLRTAEAVALAAEESADATQQCSILLADGASNVTYWFNSDENTLYYITNGDTSDPDYVLCDNITSMTFNRTTNPDDSSKIRSVRVVMTIADDADDPSVQQTLATASVIRKNL